MTALDSPVLVALVTVLGSALSTWGAIILNKRVNNASSESTRIHELERQLVERDAILEDRKRT